MARSRVTVTGVALDKVISTVLFSVEHFVNIFARTINFWWMGKLPILNVIVLLAKLWKSTTSPLYKNELKSVPIVD